MKIKFNRLTNFLVEPGNNEVSVYITGPGVTAEIVDALISNYGHDVFIKNMCDVELMELKDNVLKEIENRSKQCTN